jgi:hypothetical protein
MASGIGLDLEQSQGKARGIQVDAAESVKHSGR